MEQHQQLGQNSLLLETATDHQEATHSQYQSVELEIRPNQEPEQAAGTIVEHLLLEEEHREKVTFQLPIALNDWIDNLSRNSRRRHGHKIQKQVWCQAALELMKSLPVDWEGVESVEHLRKEIEYLSARIDELHQANLIY